MSYRLCSLLVIALAVALLMAVPIYAADKDKDNTHEGVAVKAADGKLIMTMKDDKKEHTHAVAKDAKITVDGKLAKLDDIKEGITLKATTDDKNVAIAIDATSKKEK